MTRLLWVCLGSAFGGGARYLLGGWIQRSLGSTFPFGTLAVNVIGSFLLGILMQVGVTRNLFSPTLRLALTTGVMGGFTTYSTFNYETVQSLEEGAWAAGIVNIGVTVGACLLAGFLGLAGGRALVGD